MLSIIHLKQLIVDRVPFAVLPVIVFILAAVTYNIPVGILVLSVIYALSGFVTTLMAKKNTTV